MEQVGGPATPESTLRALNPRTQPFSDVKILRSWMRAIGDHFFSEPE
jgi:hypothetical protein